MPFDEVATSWHRFSSDTFSALHSEIDSIAGNWGDTLGGQRGEGILDHGKDVGEWGEGNSSTRASRVKHGLIKAVNSHRR